MQMTVVMFGALICLSIVQCLAVTVQQPLQSKWSDFKNWAVQHNKPYLDDPQELTNRYKVWSDNVAHINTRASSSTDQPRTFRLGLTAHTDLTRQEFRERYLGAPIVPSVRAAQPVHTTQAVRTAQLPPQAAIGGPTRSPSSTVQQATAWASGRRHPRADVKTQNARKDPNKKPQHWRYENVTAPAAVDWRQHQPTVLGAIKDQHVNGTPCGSCWAFSAVSIMEIASAMATGNVVLGSEQHLIDCDRKYDHGCAGGGWLNAIQYTIQKKGLATEDQYPYTGKDGHCNKHLANQRHELQVDSWEDVPYSNEAAMTQAVSQTPIIVAICAGPAIDDWHHYTGGIFDAPCCEKDKEITLDHGIVVVGYGTENGQDYWILKNSWGSHWGEQGFMRIQRNHGKRGKCALASYPAMVFRRPLPDGPSSSMGSGHVQPDLAAV